MDILLIIVLAIGLSADSFAVSLSCGIAEKKIERHRANKIAASLALFQGGLPLVGWFIGTNVKGYIESFDHWIAFSLLAWLGAKMIIEGIKGEDKERVNIYSWRYILTLSIATSIDALVVGFSYALSTSDSLVVGAIIIGVVTFLFSRLGLSIGQRIGLKWGRISEIIGGVILIGLGVKILISHIYYC